MVGKRLLYNRRAGLKNVVVWLFVVLASCICAFALDPSLDVSQYAHTEWKIRQAFTKGTIFSIAQTPDGYLWLGTEFGLVRFDGARALPWSPPAGEQLPSNWIEDLVVTRDGTLWIGTEKGLASWKDGKLTGYPEVAGQVVTSLLQDGEGTLWFGVRNPGRLCSVRSAKTQCYGAGSFGWSVPTLYEDHHGNLWVSAETGLWRWAPGPPVRYTIPGGPVEAKALVDGDNGALLIATGLSGPLAGPVTAPIDGLKQLVQGRIQSYVTAGLPGQFKPTRLFRSSDGALWVGAVDGLLHLHAGRLDRFSLTDGLSGHFIRAIFEDREGDVWVSTEDGLDRFREFAAPTISSGQGLSTSAVTVLQATRDGSIWIITADGLNRWQSGHMTVYNPGARVQERLTGTRELTISAEIVNSGLSGTPRSLGQDDQGRLWAGSSDGVFYFERGRFVPVPGLPGGNILAIAGDGHGNVWISNLDHGLFHWTPQGTVERFPWDPFKHEYAAVALLPDGLQSGLWLGFYDGGVAYFKDGGIRLSYTAADGLGLGRVSDLQLGSDGALWAATEGGLSRIKDGRVATLTSGNGLPCDGVNAVIEDHDHSLWLYMSCGLVRIVRSELNAWQINSKRSIGTSVFDSYDGVRTRALAGAHSRLVTESPDGKIWISSPDGVSVIDPRRLPFNKAPPPVHIEQITADGRTFNAVRGLRLPPRVRDLIVEYTALSLVVPEKVRFRFKLEPQDRNWREVVNERRVEYSNLTPGNYRFRVAACNNSGVWNEAGDTLDFSIDPAYYQTAWFRASLIAAFFLLLWVFYRYRMHQLARECNAQIEVRIDERTRIARELHDTLLQGFHGLLLRFQAAHNLLPGRAADARQILESALDDAAQTITKARDAVQDLRSTEIATDDLAGAVKAMGEELSEHQAASNGAAAVFSVEVEGRPKELQPMVRDELYRIAGEAVRNAFRHARARQIEVEIRYNARQLRVRVRDDGIGIDPGVLNYEGGGRPGHWGLKGMRERAKSIGAQLELWSESGAGTEVQLTVPSVVAYGARTAERFHLFRRKVGTNS